MLRDTTACHVSLPKNCTLIQNRSYTHVNEFNIFRVTTGTDYFSQATPPNAAAAANFGHAAADFGKTRRRTPLSLVDN